MKNIFAKSPLMAFLAYLIILVGGRASPNNDENSLPHPVIPIAFELKEAGFVTLGSAEGSGDIHQWH